jgi:hypothetical protein
MRLASEQEEAPNADETGAPEEALRVPDAPGIGRSLREAGSDLFFNSWPVVPGNLLWGVLMLALLFVASIAAPMVFLAGLLALPVAGIYHVAALIVRGEGAGIGDIVAGMRRHAVPALALGYLAAILAAVFTINIFVGLEMDGIGGWVLSALALYGNIALALFVVAAWPLLVDPRRQELSVRRRLWLAVVVNLVRPAHMLALLAIIGALIVLSTLLLAALLTVTIAFVSLFSTRYVLPAADRIEGRPTVRVDD